MKAALVCAAALAIFLVECAGFLGASSATFDEAVHLTAGYSYLERDDFRLNPEHPPLVKELAALAVRARYRLPFAPDPKLWNSADEWLIANDFVYRSAVDADRILTTARLPEVALGALLVVLVGWWAFRLWGPWAAALSTALMAVDPNVVANSCLVATDVPAALFTVLAFYLLWEYGNRRTWWRLFAVLVALALALVSKFSSVFLLGIIPALMLGRLLLGGGPILPATRTRAEGVFALAVVTLAASLVVSAAYFFSGFSGWMAGLQSVVGHQGGGHPGFLLGRYSDFGWWYYFPLACAMKTPLGSMALVAAGLALARRGQPLDRLTAWALLGPVALFLAIMMFGQINIGLRHVILIYPLLYVAAGRLATIRASRRWLAPVALGAGVLLSALSSFRVAPHQLAYFNEAVGGPDHGLRLLSDSNLDWGQDLRGLQRYLAARGNPTIYLSYFGAAQPSYYGIHYFAVGPNPEVSLEAVPPDGPQLFAVSAFNQQGVRADDKALFRWLDSRRPVATIGWSIRVYDFTHDPEALHELAALATRCHAGGCGIPPFLGNRRRP